MRRCVRFYKCYCKGRAKANREKETQLRSALSRAMELLQRNPGNPTHQQRLSSCADELERMETLKLRGQQV